MDKQTTVTNFGIVCAVHGVELLMYITNLTCTKICSGYASNVVKLL